MKHLFIILTSAVSLPLFSQNVGIGTPTPQSKLHVAGCIRSDTLAYITPGVKTLFAAPNGRIYDSLALPSTLSWEINGNANITAINFLGTTNANDIIVKTNNIERMRVFSGGNFGFGITTPGVYVANTVTHPDDALGIGTLVAKGMDWGVNGFGYVASFYNQDAATANANGLLVKTANASANTKVLSVTNGATIGGNNLLTVLGNGQVGVGTSAPNPSAIMQVVSNTQGVMFPSLTSAQRLAIAGPANGLMVYDITQNILMSYNGVRWQEVGGDPIGSIEGFHKNLAGTPILPWGWVECNGQLIADPESPYNGQTMPDLNNTGLFLRGSLVSGTNQTDGVGTHNHTGTTALAGTHNHTGSTGSVNSTNGRFVPWDDNFSTNKLNAANTGALVNTPVGGGGYPWDGLATVGNLLTTIDQLDHTHVISNDGNHTHTFTTNNTGGTETRPINMSVVWIIRIK